MHLDKKLITIIASSALIGGIIGGGIGGVVGSFGRHEEGGRHHERWNTERGKELDNYSDGETNDNDSFGVAPQEVQVTNTTQVTGVTSSTTKAK